MYAAFKEKFGDFLRCISTKPDRIMILAAFIGGPIASTAYVIALQIAGSIVVPISALCPAITAILGKVLYKQELNKRMAFDILICVCASFLIGSTGFTNDGISKNTLLGLLIAIIAVGVNLFIDLTIKTFTNGPTMVWFTLSGLLIFMTWYAGNSMYGAGLSGACNGTYSFFGPLFCLLVLGVYGGMNGWELPYVAWIGAILMIIGIIIISINPIDFLKKKEDGVK